MQLKFHVVLLAVAFAASAVAVADADAKRRGGGNANMSTLEKPKKGEKRCEINGVGQRVCRTKRH
jgi:hypothetical protein